MKPSKKIFIHYHHKLLLEALCEVLTKNLAIEIQTHTTNIDFLLSEMRTIGIDNSICILGVTKLNVEELNSLENFKRGLPQLRILTIVDNLNELNIIKAFYYGASGILGSNTDTHDLVNAIRLIYATGYYFSETVLDIVKKVAIDNSKKLSNAEMVFLTYCCSELTYKEIAAKMGVTYSNVDALRKNLFNKFNVVSRTGLVLNTLL